MDDTFDTIIYLKEMYENSLLSAGNFFPPLLAALPLGRELLLPITLEVGGLIWVLLYRMQIQSWGCSFIR
jgi:hypothetical protein